MSQEFTLRKVAFEDAERIAGHRRAMFEDMGMTVTDESITAFLDWVRPKLSKGEYLGWFLTRANGEVVAGVGLWLIEWPPIPVDITMIRAYVLNVYVEADYRHQGHARRLMDAVFAYCAEQRIRVIVLHSSNKGRPLYESLGFKQTNEMRIVIDYNDPLT